MKLVRKQPVAPAVARADPVLGRVEQVMGEVRDAIGNIKPVEIKIDPHVDAPRPKAFTVTVTKRDADGRITEFDVLVKGS